MSVVDEWILVFWDNIGVLRMMLFLDVSNYVRDWLFYGNFCFFGISDIYRNINF